MDKRKRKWSGRLLLIMTVVFLLFPSMAVYAADTKILSTIVYDGSIYIFIRGVSELGQDTVVQIGNTVCKDGQVSSAPFSDSEVLMRTVILIDNSKSISDKNHADIQEILRGILSSSMEKEQFKIGTFSDQVTYLCDFSSNREILGNVADTITYNNQDTYLSDALHYVISELKSENVCAYTRIFIIADGADDNPKGWPGDEVRSYIGENAYPVYTLGIPGKNNSGELEVLFSFSRAAGSEYFLLDGSIANEDIVEAMAQDQEGVCIKVSPDESLKDGSNKSILLKLSTPEGIVELKTSVDMPFGDGISALQDDGEDAEEVEEEKNDGKKTESIPVLKPEGDTAGESIRKEETEKTKTVPWAFIIVAVSIVLAVSAAAVIFVLAVKRKKPAPPSPAPVPPSGDDDLYGSGSDTEPFGGRKADGTVPLWEEYDTYLVLKCLDDTNVMFKAPIVDILRIGRFTDQDIIINDPKLSKRHCEIRLDGDLLYIRDCNSSNGTKYEGVAVYDEERPMVSGGKIEIGEYRYQVELVKEQLGDKG